MTEIRKNVKDEKHFVNLFHFGFSRNHHNKEN